jgi:hypothetical protein
MAPVAAQVGLGVPPAELGGPLDQLQELDWPVPEVVASGIVGCVLSIDSFGNVITNIDRRVLDSAGLCGVGRVTCGGRSIADFVRTYAERPPGTAVALIGSSGLLEIAVVGGHAARWLPARVGAEIVVEP